MRSQQTDSTIIGPLHDTVDFFIDDAGRLLAIFARACRQGGSREWIFAFAKGDRAQALAHTPVGNHLVRNRGDVLQIVFGSKFGFRLNASSRLGKTKGVSNSV